jgi:hypothetical protein
MSTSGTERQTWKRWAGRTGAVAATIAAALMLPATASRGADEVVDDCSSDAQLRAKLETMQNGSGGTLTFACGDTPPPSVLTGDRLPRIRKPTTIDGGNEITLSGTTLPPTTRDPRA